MEAIDRCTIICQDDNIMIKLNQSVLIHVNYIKRNA